MRTSILDLLSKSQLQAAVSTFQDLILTSSSSYMNPLYQLFAKQYRFLDELQNSKLKLVLKKKKSLD